MIKVISHRGFWLDEPEKNTESAFKRSFENNFGTETDIRDFAGNLVISHDVPDRNAMTVSDFFSLLGDKSLPLALNIKSDGLADILSVEIEKAGIKNAFVFDMSVPDHKAYLKLSNVAVFSRASEEERHPAFYNLADGIWLDAFYGHWFDETLIEKYLNDGKKVCVVSSELHGRSHIELWTFLKKLKLPPNRNLLLCTDFPRSAREFFGDYFSD